jgi:hypothetical protein
MIRLDRFLVIAAVMIALIPHSAVASPATYETHSAAVVSSTSVTNQFVRPLSVWVWGGELGGTTSYSQSASVSWSVNQSCSWDYGSAVTGSVGISVGYTVSVTGGCSFPVPPQTYGRCILQTNGRYDFLAVNHYVWQNLMQSVPDDPWTVTPCYILIEIYWTYPTVWVPTTPSYAAQYASQI